MRVSIIKKMESNLNEQQTYFTEIQKESVTSVAQPNDRDERRHIYSKSFPRVETGLFN